MSVMSAPSLAKVDRGLSDSLSPPRPIVEFINVTKAFGPKIVYDDLTLHVNEGETFTLLGGSGSGKSVALKMLIGLLTPDSGTIRFDGRDLTGPMREADWIELRTHVSMLFQWAALFDSMSVADNVAYPLREHRRHLTSEEIDAIVDQKLTHVGLKPSEVRHMKPAELSGGMRKRVGLARAIAIEPRVVLYDEPTTGLDPINTSRINHLIRHLQHTLGITSIVVTHDMNTVRAVSDRVAMLHNRRIIFEDTLDALIHSENPIVRDFVDGHFEGHDATEAAQAPSGAP